MDTKEMEMRKALEDTLEWLIECEEELGGPLKLGYKGNMHKSRIANQIKNALM